MPPGGEPAALQALRLTKRFPGVTALDGVSFDLRPGEIHALCGENGAGKSTLIKILGGIHPHGSYEGELLVRGAPARFRSAADAGRAGIAVIHQELALVPEMSAAENLFLGEEPTRLGLIDREDLRRRALALLDRFRLHLDPDSPVAELGMGQRQLLEILKALRKDASILILDEPTTALARTETRALLDILRGLRGRAVSCVYVSHKLDEVLEIADRVTVLRDGASVVTLDAARTDQRELIRHMVGRELRELFPGAGAAPGETLLEARDLRAEGDDGRCALRGISFELRAGEVLGIGGLLGAGRSELLLHLFGAWGRRLAGTVLLGGRPLEPMDPRKSLLRGMALVTEDRRRWGLFPGRSLRFHLSLSSLRGLSRRGLLDEARERAAAGRLAAALRVKAPDLEAPAEQLSGGNQQKAVLGRALMTEPSVVLLDEPTRGIDVGAKAEIYRIVRQLADSGKGVLLVSSELPELLGLSDRILILLQGSAARTFRRGEATQETLLEAAMGRGARAGA